MTVITVTRDANWREVTEDPNLHVCMIHGIKPKIYASNKGKGLKAKADGWIRVECSGCIKENPDRYFFGYHSDPLKEWNLNNPLLDSPDEVLKAEKNILTREVLNMQKEFQDAQKELDRAEKSLDSLSKLLGKKLNRIQQIAEHLDRP